MHLAASQYRFWRLQLDLCFLECIRSVAESLIPIIPSLNGEDPKENLHRYYLKAQSL
jgi:hypothetical protein